MQYIKEPKNGYVTSNGEITWDGTYYFVWDEVYCDWICKTTNFDEAVDQFERYCETYL